LSSPASLADRYRAVRSFTEALVSRLEPEDMVVQTMPDVSPSKWHLAHTTWFFETFVLRTDAAYQVFDDHFEVLFNSYYNSVGEQFPRPQRGLLSRPTVADVRRYRAHVDAAMLARLDAGSLSDSLRDVVELGLHHEQQHQELIVTDIKHVLGFNPLAPNYGAVLAAQRSAPPLGWVRLAAGVHAIGLDAGEAFAFDNESPRHDVLIRDVELATRPVTCGEYLAFIEAGGYDDASLWLSEGWATRHAERWRAPLYWSKEGDAWFHFTLGGRVPLHDAAPVCHLSYFEADAYARWAGARLPTEAEWEVAARELDLTQGHFADRRVLQPEPAPEAAGEGELVQCFGDVWEWTQSPYVAYPGYAPVAGALGEYNGKFMCNQMVLRGGSCATPRGHVRATYRNFFPTHARWQFSGLRLARDTP